MPLIRCMGGSSGTGSIINITTGDDGLFGQTVTLSDGNTTLTSQFSNAGHCTFKNVTMIGTLTIASSVGGVAVTDTISVPYYGTIDVNFGRDMKTIEISTDEASLIGKTATLTYNTSDTKTATIDANGEATIVLYGYTGAATISATDGVDTATSNITITSGVDTYNVDLSFSKIYGVQWDGSSSSAMTRTDAAANFVDPVPQMKSGSNWTVGSSPFDNILPWSGMEIVDDATVGKLVKIPKYYYKWTKSGSTMKLQISEKEFDGSHVSPAHADRGDGSGERDYVYVGRYHCAASTYKSTSGVKPAASATRSAFRTSIHNLGSKYWQFDFAMFWTIRMLYLVEFADWNAQKKIGYGCGDNSATSNMGYTDSMPYHTGTTQTSRTTYGFGTQYRYIEGLWDNVLDWCDGVYFAGTSNADIYVINNPANFSDSSGGTKTGTRPTSSGCIKAWGIPSASGLEWALYPSEVVTDDNYATYICDRCYYYSSNVVLYVGGYYYQSPNYGAFYLYSYSASSSFAGIGSRLQKLP